MKYKLLFLQNVYIILKNKQCPQESFQRDSVLKTQYDARCHYGLKIPFCKFNWHKERSQFQVPKCSRHSPAFHSGWWKSIEIDEIHWYFLFKCNL